MSMSFAMLGSLKNSTDCAYGRAERPGRAVELSVRTMRQGYVAGLNGRAKPADGAVGKTSCG